MDLPYHGMTREEIRRQWSAIVEEQDNNIRESYDNVMRNSEERGRDAMQASLNTFHRSGSAGSVDNAMNRVRSFLQETSVPESTLVPLHQLSYETLVKQLYGLPVILPEFLILNGLKVNFVPFSQLNTIQIDRYIIEPLLQPWAGLPSSPNRIITIFGTNGITYLIKAKYDQSSNQIYPPV